MEKQKRYCKLCGGLIDQDTKKCRQCGKQYFNLRISSVIAYLLSVAAISVSCLSTYRANNFRSMNTEYQEEIIQLSETIQSLKESVVLKDEDIERYKKCLEDDDNQVSVLNAEKNALIEKISLYEKYVVFVVEDGSQIYHNEYDCYQFTFGRLTSQITVYSPEQARSRGYFPCPNCYK